MEDNEKIVSLLDWVEKRIKEEKVKQSSKERHSRNYIQYGGKIRGYKEVKQYIIDHL